MNERVAVVVDGFRNLTDAEKTDAYIQIEEVWKALQDRPTNAPDARQNPQK